MSRPASHSVEHRTPRVSLRMTMLLVAALSLGLAIISPGFSGYEPPKAPASVVQETWILKIKELDLIGTLASPDNHHIALAAKTRKPEGFLGLLTRAFDPTAGPKLSIGNPGPKVFHPNAVLSAGTAYQVYLDDRASAPFSLVCGYCMAFSPDSKHLAFAASRDSLPPKGAQYTVPCRTWSMVLDSTASPTYDDVSTPTFSPDGEHFAYLALQGAECFLVLDGKPGPSFASGARRMVTFSPDGDHVAYVASVADSQFVVVDGQPGPRFVLVADVSLRFSPDGSRLAYVVVTGAKSERVAVVVDGRMELACDKLGPLFPKTGDEDPMARVDFVTFSSDSRHYAYAAEASSRWSVVVDGKAGRAYDAVFPPIFRGDGTQAWYAAREHGKWFLLGEGVPDSARYDELRYNPVASLPGDHWAYAVREDKQWSMIVDGMRGPKVDEVWVAELVFSPDGSRYAYTARTGKKEFLVLDGQAGPAWDAVVGICFSPDGQHVAYTAKQGGRVFVLADGVAGPTVDDVVKNGVRFESNGTAVEYLAMRDGSLCHIRQALVPASVSK